MSMFDDYLLKSLLKSDTIVDKCIDKYNKELQEALDFINNVKNDSTRESSRRPKNASALQSIREDDDVVPVPKIVENSKVPNGDLSDGSKKKSTRTSKKRSKNEVEDMLSPEVEKRMKRNALVKAQTNISKQVNVNLVQKMRRGEPEEPEEPKQSRTRRGKNKENVEPIVSVKVKQEKISIDVVDNPPLDLIPEIVDNEEMDAIVMPPPSAPVPMKQEKLSIEVVDNPPLDLEPEIVDNEEMDAIVMPPPSAPVPKPRTLLKEKKAVESCDEPQTGRQRRIRNRATTDMSPPVAVTRATRASNRSSTRNKQVADEQLSQSPPQARPKRTRNRKAKPTDDSTFTSDKDSSDAQEKSLVAAVESSSKQVSEQPPPASPPKTRPKRVRNKKLAEQSSDSTSSTLVDLTVGDDKTLASPAEKKTKLTKKAQKADNQAKQQANETKIISPLEEKVESHEEVAPEVLPSERKAKEPQETARSPPLIQKHANFPSIADNPNDDVPTHKGRNADMEETVLVGGPSETVTLDDQFNHISATPENHIINETVVIEKNNETIIIEKREIMETTVIIERGDKKQSNITCDDSLITNDSGECVTPQQDQPKPQPVSAVKEKVQQFEELATRATRTKTRAMAKKQEEENDKCTPPDKTSKAVLSAETLLKMNKMIFNGKPPQVSQSASKARAMLTPASARSAKVNASASKAIPRRDEAQEKDDARLKKDALLQKKRDEQRRKREEKMAAAAAAREAAEKERNAALSAAINHRNEKQAQADQGKLERLKEFEKRKRELARKTAETEERRRAEELARRQRLEEELRKADAVRRKQLEAEANRREAALCAKEMDKIQKDYLDKQKRQQRTEHPKISPVYMADGFEHLNSDSESEESGPARPVPLWSTQSGRAPAAALSACVGLRLLDGLFTMPPLDLRDIFPAVDRKQLIRGSSAVWRTPPKPLPTLHE